MAVANSTTSLKCEVCTATLSLYNKFCATCGVELDEETLALKHYFNEGYEYEVILCFLLKYYGIEMSLRTLKERFKSLGLRRRNLMDSNNQDVRARIQEELDGPGCLLGYRSMWYTLRREGYQVSRQAVATCLQEMDPEGCERRRRRKLKRRVNTNPGPNYYWHIDGYDKIKPDGFAIHGCIDGYSRKVIWLRLDRTNNNPVVIGRYYMNAVKEYGGCPLKVRTDCGTENGLVAVAQCYFIGNDLAHIYGTSPHNQRIEGWWSYLRQHRTTWWINFFKDLMEQQVFTTGNELQMECLWFCFSGLIQQDLDRVKEHWNSHYIRGSRYDTVKGRPNELFYLPELHNTEDFLLLSVHSSVTISQRINLPLQRAPMNTRSIFSMPFKLQDFQTPKTGEKPWICTIIFIPMHLVDFFSVRPTCPSSD